MDGFFDNIKIAGIASAVPEYVMNNMDLEDVFGSRRVRKQAKLTGVVRHHIQMSYQKTSDLCMHAAEKLLTHLGWDRSEVKILLFGTQSADYKIPSTSIDLSARLGFGKDCMAYDINLGCSSFDLCLQTAASLLQTQQDGSKALIMVGDSAYLPAMTAQTKDAVINSMMFGGGGGVAAIEKRPGNSFVFSNSTDGTEWDAILRYYATDTMMKGNKVFEYAINDVATNLMDFLKNNSIGEDDYDCIVFHQAQKLIIDSIVDTCALNTDKVFNSYEEYGNTSGASVPISICHNKEKLKSGSTARIISCGFGVGLSMGISCYEIDTNNILPVYETKEYNAEHMKRHGALYTRNVLVVRGESDLAKWIIRQLDRASCHMTLCGKKQDIERLKPELYWKDIKTCSELSGIDDKECFDSIVYDMSTSTENDIYREVTIARDNNLLSEDASIVLINTTDKECETQSILKQFTDKFGMGIRINAVLYNPDEIDTYPHILDSPDWFERCVHMENPIPMILPIYISNAVIFFASLSSRNITQSIRRVQDMNYNKDKITNGLN